jgi:ABC-type antimicrobial peptide transport system permease subunit
VLGESLGLVLAGTVAGVPLSLATGYLLRGFLFGVTAHDILSLTGAGALLAAVAVLAAVGPARRASKIDPVVALRYE